MSYFWETLLILSDIVKVLISKRQNHTQTVCDMSNDSVPEGLAQVEFCASRNCLGLCIWSGTYIVNICIPGCCYFLSPTRKVSSYSDQTLTFASHSKRNSEGCPSNQVFAAAMTSASDEKWRPFNCFFSGVGLRTYQHPCTRQYSFKSKLQYNGI